MKCNWCGTKLIQALSGYYICPNLDCFNVERKIPDWHYPEIEAPLQRLATITYDPDSGDVVHENHIPPQGAQPQNAQDCANRIGDECFYTRTEAAGGSGFRRNKATEIIGEFTASLRAQLAAEQDLASNIQEQLENANKALSAEREGNTETWHNAALELARDWYFEYRRAQKYEMELFKIKDKIKEIHDMLNDKPSITMGERTKRPIFQIEDD